MPEKEISTNDIVQQAFKDGKKVFVPYIHPGPEPKSKVMDMLLLRDQKDLESLQPDAWGIPSLSEDSIEHRENALGGTGISDEDDATHRKASMLNLVFMPAVAFDQSHNRLGHGKGFYDRYLTRYRDIARSKGSNPEKPFLGESCREEPDSLR